jgi:outer membrane protein OmpA-like peptidoglycan-associated protein
MGRPLLGDVELQQVQELEIDEDQVLVQHGVPALEGDFLQGLGRRGTQITVVGTLTGAQVGDGLKALRDKFYAAEPVPFVADITTATRVDQVLIQEMGVRELAGRPQRFEYTFTLREYTSATRSASETPPPPPPEIEPETATLIVRVIVGGEPGFDHSQTTLTVEGTTEDGAPLDTLPLTNRQGNVWTEEGFEPGTYTVTASTSEPESMTGAATANVPRGETEDVTIYLRRGQVVAKAFVIHHTFDNAFIEPCMRAVMHQVAGYAQAHPAEKLAIVGHTDESGSADYNQALSERRARSAYAYLTFGLQPDASVAEWDELRKQRAPGVTRSERDGWGTREVQYMLQDLGHYPGNVHGNRDDATIQAIRDFQTVTPGLSVDGIVGDQTWPALIRAYMAQDDLQVEEGRLVCNGDGQVLHWVGCSESFPVRSTPGKTECPPETAPSPSPDNPPPACPTCSDPAWRPNRRTEFLFAKQDQLTCTVPQPYTQGGPGNLSGRCCFITRDATDQDRWLVQPAEQGSVIVSGSIRYADGQPFAHGRYVLTAPDGRLMDGEQICKRPGKGLPIPGRTDGEGEFAYTDPTRVGVYSMEVELPAGPHVAYLEGRSPATGRGSVVCRRLEPDDATFDVIVQPGGLSQVAVTPSIVLASQIVVVKKPYTNPSRQEVTLSTSSSFTGTGTFTRSSPAVRFFTAESAGAEITFDGTDNVFTGAQLSVGIRLFAEGTTPSATPDDVQLTLALAAPGLLVEPPATATMTSVALTLDIAQSRGGAGVDPMPLPQPPETPPAPGPANDKWFGGRFVHVQDPGRHHGRALLIVRQVQPAGFSGDLVLRQVTVAGQSVGGLDTKVQVFDNEAPAAGDTAKGNPHEVNAAAIPPAGLQFWVEGASVSGALRDTGFQLGIKDLEEDGDRITMTVVRLSNLQAEIPSTPPNTPRLSNGPVPASRLQRGTAATPAAVDFEDDFTANIPLVLIRDSVPIAPGGAEIDLSVSVAPAGVPVSWTVQRDTRPAPDGDSPGVVALSPSPVPTLTPNGVNPLRATISTDAVGSFHIRPFVDCNGNGQFDAVASREPYMVMNLVLIQVGGAGSVNSSRAQPGNIAITPATPTAATGVSVSTGSFAAPAPAGIHNDATIAVTGGGGDGRRGLDRLFAGWINNELAVATSPTVPSGEDVVAEYRDTTGATPVIHRRTSIWTSVGAGTVFGPATAPGPALVAGPVLDTTNFGNEGTGGNRAVGTEGAVGPPVPIAKTPQATGERWRVQMWDSPGDSCPPNHGFFPGNLHTYRFNLDFQSDLCFWTNITGVPGPTPGPITGAPPPRPDAACCLYASVQTNIWQIRVAFTFNPATGASTPNPGNTIAMQRDPNPLRLARPVQVLEVRPPISLSLLATDASA